MHNNWKTVKIGDIATVISGATPDTTRAEFWDGDIDWITPTEMTKLKNGRITKHTERRITALGLKSCAATLIPAGSLILCSRATVGVCAINEFPLTTNQGFKNLIPNGSVDVNFLYYLITLNRNHLIRISSGSTFLEFSKYDLEKIKVNIPELLEQKQIVNILNKWGTALELVDEKIRIKKELKLGIAQQLLSGTVRLAEFNDTWRPMKLGDIATIKRGGSPRPIDSYFTNGDDGLNWLKIGDIKPGSRYITRTAQKIKPEGLNKTTMVHEGDFILSNSMSFGRPYIMKISACIHDGWLALMDIKPAVNKSFLFYMLSSNKIQGKFKALSAGSGVQNLKKETVATVEIQLPSVEEQTAIAKILHDADDEIELLVEERRLIAAQRDYLIQNLITGKLRLPIAKADSKETTNA